MDKETVETYQDGKLIQKVEVDLPQEVYQSQVRMRRLDELCAREMLTLEEVAEMVRILAKELLGIGKGGVTIL